MGMCPMEITQNPFVVIIWTLEERESGIIKVIEHLSGISRGTKTQEM